MRKGKLILCIMIMLMSLLCGCKDKTDTNALAVIQEDNNVNSPDLLQIRSICKLATLECYYHNVAKSKKSAGTGLTHLGEIERAFWVEYDGTVKIGVDMSRGSMDVDGTNVTIYMPEAEILSIKLESESIGGTITSPDSWNKNPIDEEDVTNTVNSAQESIKEEIEKDTSLFADAQNRAKKLIGNYINKLGETTGTKFTVNWETVYN